MLDEQIEMKREAERKFVIDKGLERFKLRQDHELFLKEESEGRTAKRRAQEYSELHNLLAQSEFFKAHSTRSIL
jgi:hypothetical protein